MFLYEKKMFSTIINLEMELSNIKNLQKIVKRKK